MLARRLFVTTTSVLLVSLIAIPPTFAGPTPSSPQPSPEIEVHETRAPFSADRRTAEDGSRLAKNPRAADTGRRVLVKLRSKVSRAKLKSSGVRLGYRVVQTVPGIGWAVIEPTRKGERGAAAATRAKRAGLVQRVAPEVWIQPAARPSDPFFAEQWGFENTGQTGGNAGADARSVPAWTWSKGDGVVVAVTDTGIDFSHPDLAGQQWVNPGEVSGNGVDDDGNGKVDDVNGWDFYRADASVYDAGDGDKHGTHVAATIAAATDNGIGGAGTAPGARLMSAKFLGPSGGSDTNGAAAIVYAVNEGADIINCSWAGSTYSAVIADAIAYAANHGVLVVCAAGNEGVDNDATPTYPASYPATNVVSVAALTDTDSLAMYSNRGATSVDLGAPGSEILSAQPKSGASLLIDKAPYRVVYHAFPLEKVTDPVVRNDMIVKSVGALASSKTTPIMVVDDSWSSAGGETANARSSAYTSALTAAGYTTVTTWRRDALGVPTAASMAGKVVIWFTGAASYGVPTYASYGTLSSAERTVLAAYLDGGGRLLLSSGDTAYDLTWVGGTAVTFLRNYLHTRYADDDPWTGNLVGRAGSLLGSASVTVSDPLRYSDGSDDVVPYDSYATTIADWYDYATISGTSMASPHVAGTLALMRTRFADMPAEELKARLLSTVRPVPSLVGKTATGGALDTAAAVGQLAAPVRLTARAGTGSVTLSWTNPTDSDFERVRVLARGDQPPTGPADPSATLVYEGTGTTALHKDLAAGIAQNYAAYGSNRLGAWSESVVASCTPLAPLAVADRYRPQWNRAFAAAAPGVLGNDGPGAGNPALARDASHGHVAIAPDGSFVYQPVSGYFGPDEFSYSVSDATRSETATVSLDVRRFRLDALSASAASPGTRVTLAGTGFGDEQGGGYVTFAGTRATVVSWSDTSVVALVPPASSSGYVGVKRDGVSSNGLWFKPTPRVDSMSASTGLPGDLVTLTGAGFGVLQGTGFVTFGGTQAIVLTWSDTAVTAIVPSGFKAGYAGVSQNGVMSNGLWFAPPRPVLDALSTGNGAYGTQVAFRGRGFGDSQGSGYVSFAGTRAQVLSWTDTKIVATVPSGASAGYAGVFQNGYMSNGKYFVPFAGPHVDSLSSYSDVPGSLLTLQGTGFGASQGAGWVTFGGTAATVVSWSDTSVSVIVPVIAGPVYAGVVQNGVYSNGKYFIPSL